MADEKPLDKVIDRLIDSTLDASRRSRTVIIFLVMGSVVAFSSGWKTFRLSWIDSRAVKARHTYEYWDFRTKSNGLDLDQADQRLQKAPFNIKNQEERAKKLKRMQDGQAISDARLIISRKQAEQYLFDMERMRNEMVLQIRLPFFGVSFDVNDVSLLMGVSSVILLMSLRMTLRRELNSLDATFTRIITLPPERQVEVYDLLRVNQVLSSPASLTDKDGEGFWWSHVDQLLVLLPVMVHAFIFVNDVCSRATARLLDPDAADFSIAVGFAALLFVGVLAWNCLVHLDRIEKQWQAAAIRLRGLAKVEIMQKTAIGTGLATCLLVGLLWALGMLNTSQLAVLALAGP